MSVYCGLNPPPKGKKRGTASQCLAKKQVRYYGKVAIPTKKLTKPRYDLQKEIIKANKLNLKAKVLVNDFKKLNIRIENARTVKEEKRLVKQKKPLLKKKMVLLKQIEKQKALIDHIKALQTKKRKKVVKKPKRVIDSSVKKILKDGFKELERALTR
jgi:hypothetical protein